MDNTKGKIIFLNGCSSAGKTSLVKAIQMLGSEPWLTLGVDSLFATLPAKYFINSPNSEKKFEGVQFIKKVDKDGFPIVEIKEGSYAKKFYQSVPKLVKQLVDDEHNLVIDEVIWEKKLLESYALTMKNHRIIFVNVYCELNLMVEREKLRGDRLWGFARWQFAKMKDLDWNYDLEVDTSHTSPFINAQKILEFLKKPEAFAKNN